MSTAFHKCCPVGGMCTGNCETYINCYGGGCESAYPLAVASYLTIGKPDGNTMMNGPYWTAWHNGITSPNAYTAVDFDIAMYKRTYVQAACDDGECLPLPTPSVVASCSSTAMTADAGCARTLFVDNYLWKMEGNVYFKGPSNSADRCVDESPTQEDGYPPGMGTDPVQYTGIYPGPFPFELTDTTKSGLTPNDAVTTGSNDSWMPGENRCHAPRFSSNGISVSRSDIPVTTYDITAECGSSTLESRCDNSKTEDMETVCWDFITVMPGHDSTFDADDFARCEPSGASCECGLPTGGSYPAHVDSPENGAANAAWGIDIQDDELFNILLDWGINTTVAIGTLSTAWLCLTAHGKVRILFGIEGSSDALAYGEVLSWKDGVQRIRSETITLSNASDSLAITLTVKITPHGWCKQHSGCPCVVSYSEQDLAEITTSFHGGSGGSPDSFFGAGCDHVVSYGTYVLGLEDYDIPYCALSPPGCTLSCQNYPISTSFVWAYTTRSDFVGVTPVERAHAGWKQYRNKFNHWRLVNVNLTPQALGEPGIGTDCCSTGKFIYGGAGWDQLWMPECTAMTSSFVAANQPCPGDVGTCVDNLDWPNMVPAGCHHVVHNDTSNNFSLGLFINSPVCMSCTPEFSNYYACGPCFFIGACGVTLFDDCDCCNRQATIGLPEVMIVDYDPTANCTPVGTWDLYQATAYTMCDRAAWLPLGYAVVT